MYLLIIDNIQLYFTKTKKIYFDHNLLKRIFVYSIIRISLFIIISQLLETNYLIFTNNWFFIINEI